VISSFPRLLPDEILYSILARYHVWSRNFSAKETLRELFCDTTICASVELPTNLAKIVASLPIQVEISVEKLVKEHTLFPLYSPFLSKECASSSLAKMSDKQGRAIYLSMGLMPSTIPSLNYFRYCPICYDYDLTNCGEAYWHRSHQIFGIEACSHHNVLLQDSTVRFPSNSSRHLYNALNHSSLKDLSSKEADEKQIQLAQAANWILQNDVPILGLTQLKDKYIKLLQQADLATFRGRVHQQDLLTAFRNYYSDEYLQRLRCSIDSPDNWLSRLVRSPRVSQHPLKHILLMSFLGTHPQEFFSREYSSTGAFGSGPWPCLNAAASHYQCKVIQNCVITRDYKTGDPVGTFTCSCGFSYARKGPDECEEDLYRIGRIKSFGDVWLNRLAELLVDEKCSMRAVAKKLCVDPGTIKNQLVKIMADKIKVNNMNLLDIDMKRENYRTQWILMLRTNPDKSKTQLRKLNDALFTWLYRNDKEWLVLNSPALKSHVVHSRVDWDKRDREIAVEVMNAINELKKDAKTTCITISSVGKKIMKLGLLQKHLDKLPRTRIILSFVTYLI